MNLQALVLSLLLLTIISNTESRSLESSFKCATSCAEPQNVKFTPGYTYQYSYAAAVISSFHDGPSPDQSSEINIRANAMIDVLSHCEMVLRVTEASIENGEYVSAENAARWIDNLQRRPLHFNFQDGQIPHVCASNDDPTWVLNIKRGILSALQVSSVETIDAVKETDVTGACESSYEVEGNNQERVIVKRKNYNTCEGRDKHLLFSHFTPYTSESPRQNFIHSAQTCTQRILERQLLSTICEEEHVFRPFSNAESGARTILRQSLQSYGRRAYYSAATLGITEARRTDLVFESEENFPTSTDISELRSLYSDLCTTMAGENYKQVGKDFIKMVFLLRRLDASSIEQAYNALSSACPRWETSLKGMFQDALQWCGSEGCVVFATQLIEAGPTALPDDIASRWLTGMSLITKPTLPMLHGMMAVVQSGRLTEQSYLTAGTMIHRLCAASATNCLSEPVVTRALAVFEGKLGVNCRTSNPDQNQDILLALRALGNAGRTSAISTLAACVQEESNDMETRVSAAQTFRRMPCNTDRSALKHIVFDTQQDSEIRIASYLSVMKCPTPRFIREAVVMLDDEPVQQVASFIWSHMNQILESKDPLKGYMKPLLLEAEFSKKHDLDPRKYSRYYEASLYSEALNVGGTVESSVVWSPKSFVPRSADFDLTVDVFGQAVNLLEMGGRVEGFEQMIQTAMTSDGFLKNNPLSQLFMPDDDDNADDEDDEVEFEDRPPRRTRETDGTRLVEIQNEFKSNLKTENTPKASWYLRVFGNEMYYQNLKTMQEKVSPVDVRSMFAQLAQGGEYQYHDDTMLMNSAHVLPTGLGLPLTIAFNGSASVDVNANGNLDMASYFQGGNLAMEGSLTPRAVILVTGSMSVDAMATKTGIATESSATTSWTLRGRASISESRSVEVRFDAPYNRNTLFSFNHKIMKLNGDEVVDIGRDQTNAENDCSNEFGGQRICIESTPNAVVFPITGPFVLSTYLEKTDSGFDHYLLEATYNTQYDSGIIPSELQAAVRLDTPGSTVNRETNIVAAYNRDQMQFDVTALSPEKNIILQGVMEMEPMRKHVAVTCLLNEERTRFEATIQREQDGSEARWSVSTSLERPSKTISATASASLNPATSTSARLEIRNVFATPVIASASLQDISNGNRLRYQGNSQLSIPGYVDTGARITMDITPRIDAFLFGLSYEINEMPEHSIHILHKRRDQSTSTVTRWEAEQKMTISQFPHFNHHAVFTFVDGPGQLNSFAKIGVGRHAGHRDNDNYLLMNQTLDYRFGERTEISSGVDFELLPFNIRYNVNLSHVQSSSHIDSNLKVNSHGISFFARDNAPDSGLMNKEIQMEIPTPWGSVKMQDSIQETRKNVYDLRGKLIFGAAEGLTIYGECGIENVRNRKGFSVQVLDNSRHNLLTAQSVFKFLPSTGFSWKNAFQSQYWNLINFNVRHEGREQGGFQNIVLIEHLPNTYLKTTVDVEKSPDNFDLAMRVDFKESSGTVRNVGMQLGMRESTTPSETVFNSTVLFSHNMPQIPFNRVRGSAEFRKSLSSYHVGTSFGYNGNELMGVDGSFGIDRQPNQSVLRTSLTLRQRFSDSIPNPLTLTATGQTAAFEAYDVTATYSHGNQLTASCTIYINATRFEGSVTQRFDTEAVPENVEVVLQKLRGGFELKVTHSHSPQKTIRIIMEHNGPQTFWVNLYQDDPTLLAYAPRFFDATLRWGTRPFDNGKGIELIVEFEENQPLVLEMLYYNDDTKALHINLEHQVSRFLSESIWIPQVHAKASARGPLASVQVQSSLQVDDTIKYKTEFDLQENGASLIMMHNFDALHSLPKTIKSNTHWSLTENPTAEVFFGFDDISTTASLSATSSLVSLNYFSNCSLIGGNYSAEVKKSSDLVTLNLSSAQEQNEVHVLASVGFNKNEREFTGDVVVKQYQSEYEDLQIPVQTKVRIAVPSWKEYSFTAQYNDKAVEFNGRMKLAQEFNKFVLVSRYSDNIWDSIPNVNSRLTIDIDSFSSFSIKSQYKINEQPRTTIQLSVSLAEGSNSKTMLTITFRHSESKLAALGLPEDISLALSGALLRYGVKGSVVATINNQAQELNALARLDPLQQSLRLGMDHNMEFLAERGIFRNFTLGCRTTLSSNSEIKDIKFSGFVQVNDNKYEVDASGSLQNIAEESKVEISTEFGHNIMPLYSIGFPLRLRTKSIVGYSIMAGDLSGGFSTNTTIFRTMLDDETRETYQIENHVASSVDIQLFSWSLAFSGSHDFNIPALPQNLKYEISASGSTTSQLFHKSLAMSLTLDGKTETASFTINYNPTSNSFTITCIHNAARIEGYGVPRQMSVSFRKSERFNVDLEIIYDTTKKIVDFKVDYHTNRMHFDLLLNHNFDTLVEEIGIPKTVGFEIGMPYTSNNAELELRYKWGKIIKTGHIVLRWEMFDTYSLSYSHHQNFTSTILPRNVRLDLSSSYNTHGFISSIRTGRNRLSIAYDNTASEGELFAGIVSIRQNYDTEMFPRFSEFRSSLSDNKVLELSVNFDRKLQLHTTLTGILNMEEKSGSIKLENMQQFVDGKTFPVNFDFYVNGSIGDEISAYLSLARDNYAKFEVGFKSGINVKAQSGFVELLHSQKEWKKTVPKRVRVEATYFSDTAGNQYSLLLNTKLGKRRNEITLGSEYGLTDEAVYGSLRYTHNFDQYQENVPMTGMFNILLEKSAQRLTAQANVSLDELSLQHSVQALFNFENSRLSASFEMRQENIFLSPYNIPHTVSGMMSSTWEEDISVMMRSQYGDKTTNLQLSTDQASRAELTMSHTWEFSPRSVIILLSRMEEDSALSMALSVDDVQRQVSVSFSLNENQGELHLTHEFEGTLLPQSLTLGGSYTMTPNYSFTVSATVDGQEYTLTASYAALEDGFHITSSLLDVTRSTTFRKSISPGRFSVDIDHNIPELLSYLPGSIGIAASATVSPQPNATFSIRTQGRTSQFTSQADLDNLQFTLKHDFEFLPVPHSINIALSGSRNPYHGTVSTRIDGIERAITGLFDVENMILNLNHNIPELPFPKSMRISGSGTMSPLSGQISLTIDDLDRSISVTFDRRIMQGRLQHTIPEFDQLISARDVTVKLEGGMEPLNGELYVLIDGLERRIRATFDREQQRLSIYQNIPETRFLPSNITLSFEGSMEPISGFVRLTTDGVERSVETEINMLERFVAFAHSIPEADTYIPNHMSLSAEFTETSGQVIAQYTKNGQSQNASASLTVYQNHLRAHMSHTLRSSFSIPSEMTVEISGSIEHKNASMHISADESFASANAEVLFGQDGWYGGSIESHHNIRVMKSIPNNLVAMVKGRKTEKTFEIAVNIDGLENCDLSAAASVSPTFETHRAVLDVTYDHTYNGNSYSVSGSLAGLRTDGIYKLMLDGSQTRPDLKQVNMVWSIQGEFNDQYQISLGFESSHNIPKFVEYGIPRSVQNGQISLVVIPQSFTVRGETNVQMDNHPIAYSFNARAQPSTRRFVFNSNVILNDMTQNKAFSGEFSVNVQENSLSVSHNFAVTNRNRRESLRNDNSLLTVTLNGFDISARLEMNQQELNQFGFPTESEIVFRQNKNGNTFSWILNGVFDSLPVNVKLMHRMQSSPFEAYISATFDQSLPILVTLSVPEHLSSEISTTAHISDSAHFDYAVTVEGGELGSITFNGSAEGTIQTGNIGYDFKHNIASWQRYLGYSKLKQSYSYTIGDSELRLTGVIATDDTKQIGNFNWIFNLRTYEIAFTGQYGDQSLNVELSHAFTEPKQTITLSMRRNGDILLLLDYINRGSILNTHFINHLYGPQFDISFKAELVQNGYDTSYVFVVTAEDVYTTTISLESYSESGLTGKRVSFNYVTGEQRLNSALLAAGRAQGTVGKLEFTFSNKNALSLLPKKIQVSGNYGPQEAHVVIAKGRKSLSLGVTFEKANGNTLAELTFHNNHINFLQSMNVPQEISFSFRNSPSMISVTLRADDIVLFGLESQSKHFDISIRDLAREVLFSSSGTYRVTPQQSVYAVVVCQPIGLNVQLNGALKMFETGTGNSSLSLSLIDNTNSKKISINGFLTPTSRHAEDFLGIISISSLPFNIRLKYNSTLDERENAYLGDFSAMFNDVEFALEGKVSSYKHFSIKMTQPWFETTPVIALTNSITSSSNGHAAVDMRLQWNTNEDSLTMNILCKNTKTNVFNSIHIIQPSALFYGVSDYSGSVSFEQTESEALKFGVNSRLNSVKSGLNITYNGALPQVFGSHNLMVDIIQPSWPSMSEQFIISVSSNAAQNVDFRVTSQGNEVLVLRSNCNIRERGVSFDLLWKQEIFPSISLGSLVTQNSIETTPTGVHGRTALQINGLASINSEFEFGTAGDNDRFNKSVRVSVTTGPMNALFGFRTLSVSSWYQFEFDGRETAPAFGAVLVVDGKTYRFESSGHSISSRGTARLDGNVSISQPHDLILFGIRMPKESEGSLNVIARGKGSRIFITYINDQMENPFKIRTRYRFRNDDMLFEINSDVNYGPEDDNDEVAMRINVARNDKGMDNTVTLSMQYPEYGINGEMVLGSVNSDATLGLNAVAKKYSNGEVFTWETRLSLDKQTNAIELYLNKPDTEAAVLRVDLVQAIGQGKQILRRISSDVTDTKLRFIKGFEQTRYGYDMYVGYEVIHSATYTLHLTIEVKGNEGFIAIQTKKNFQLDAEVARASLRHPSGRLIQLKISANPVVSTFVQKFLAKSDEEMTEKVNLLANGIVEVLELLKTVVTGLEHVKPSSYQQMDAAIAKVNAIRDDILRFTSTLATTSSDKFDQANLALEEAMRKGITSLLKEIENIGTTILLPFTDIVDQYTGVVLRRIKTSFVRQLQPMITELRKINAGELAIELIEEALRNTIKFVIANGEASLNVVRRPLSGLLVVSETELIFNIPLSFEIDHFVPLPSANELKNWLAQSALAIKIDDAVNVLSSYTNHYYRAQALLYIPRDELLPPFKGHAFVSGFRHFSTFDKRHFSFASGCATSHVLAADLRDRNFTVSITYADPLVQNDLNSIEVIVGNRHVVIRSDYKVEMNGRFKQLPLDLNLLTVVLEGNVIHVRRPEGDMDVACDFTKELCTVAVSPYYFGATAGLAGIYNNEPMDDFMTPSHEIASTPGDLASSWEVSGAECSSVNTYQPCDSSASAICSALFEDLKSPMRSCFPLVDPKEFMKMCLDEMCRSEDVTKVCSAAHAYAYRCNLVGAKVILPDQCVVCSDAAGNEFDTSQTKTINVTGLDVVLVIEQGSCMSQRGLYKSMRKFFKSLGGALSQARMRDNRYHLVGYGGPGASTMPNTFTLRNNRFTTRKNDVVKALRKISLSSEQVHADALSAVSYATQLPFRAGAKSVIVLLSCDHCHSESEVGYGNVEFQLRQQRILFHHMPQQRISAGKRSVYGFDDTHAFSKGNNVVSSSIVKQSKEDLCVPLATYTGGSVWDATRLDKSNFVAKVSRYIVDRANARSQQTCTCKMNNAGVPTSVCTV